MEPRTQESSFRGDVIKSCEVVGLRLVDSVYSAKTKVLKHAHEHAFFCIALTGLCSEDLGGKVRRYEASEVEFLPANRSHSLDFPFADTRAFSINIDTSWIERARDFSLRLDNSVHARGGLLSGLMIKIYGEFRNPDSASSLAIQGLTMEMLAAVSRHPRGDRHDRHPQMWLARAVELLRESFT
jgi:AraC family transcriptional regulator